MSGDFALWPQLRRTMRTAVYFDCNESVQRTLSCGHRIRLPCCEDESKKLCEVKVLRDLERCGHSAMMPCHAGTDPSQCPIQCNRELPCGHKCLHTCGQCFQAGECKCDAVCAKMLVCGHRCSKRCGEPCEPCMETCLNSCKHQGCGDGGLNQVFKYARKCSQLCALCPKFCDNSCQHRSCNKKCYEMCDVKPCDQPCTTKLSCGHGCLGMCGETCPTICGTCNKQTYVRLLKEFIGADATLTRLPRSYSWSDVVICSLLSTLTSTRKLYRASRNRLCVQFLLARSR